MQSRNEPKLRKKRLFHRIITADGTPHQVALGVGIGTYVAFMPIPGMQMLLAGCVAVLLRANKALSVMFVWISNAITSIPIFLFNYGLGCWLLRRAYKPKILWDGFARMSARLSLAEKIYLLRSLADALLLPLWIGSLITASILSVCSYFTVKYIVKRGITLR